MFKRKKTEPGRPVSAPPPPVEADDEPRTTCYPQDADALPGIVGEPRTTVYRQSVRWNRGGYDTTN
jgi:hypothetical protein